MSYESDSPPIDRLEYYGPESSRPLVGLIFVAPLLVVYEVGVLYLGPESLRNGADVWLRHLLGWIGFGQYFLLPLATCAVLLGWHHVRQQSWTIRYDVLPKMGVESFVFAVMLRTAANVQFFLFEKASLSVAPDRAAIDRATIERLVGYCGAGIYEELLFRVFLLPVVASLLRSCGLNRTRALAWAVVASSLAFSAAHYDWITPAGDAFDLYTFTFRAAAGVFFALLFIWRGFGIAAGSHACYDILVEFA